MTTRAAILQRIYSAALGAEVASTSADSGCVGVEVGFNSRSNGSYSLGGNGTVLVKNQYVGYSGTATFVQTSGTNVDDNLYLGNNSGSNGTYSLNGSGQLLSTSAEYVGYSGSGTLTQTGGTNSIGPGSTNAGNLLLGYSPGSNGAYSLSGSGILGNPSVPYYEYVGYSGIGTFLQSGGTNNSRYLYLGYMAGSTGTYLLSGGQMPATLDQVVGYSGTGAFTQTGGTNSIQAGAMIIGNRFGSVGTYNLSGGALLTESSEVVGGYGKATFTQSGGTNTIGLSSPLYLGDESGATGIYILTGSGQLSAFFEYVAWAGAGTFIQSGGTNTASGPVYLGYSGGSGTYTLTGNSLLSSPTETLFNSVDIFTHSGGTNNIGQSLEDYGTYNLSGSGVLSAATEYVYNAFTQTGGTNGVSGTLRSSGTYSLGGSGLLSAPTEYVGYNGTGTFTQSAGTNAAGTLALGFSSGASGAYNFNGGLLSVTTLTGGSGAAIFKFNGGTLQAGNSFVTTLPMTLGTSGGGATFDTAGNSVTLSGSLSGPGSLTLNDSVGAGKLLLAASNTYTGATIVNQGELVVDGWLTNSPVSVNSGGTLAGTGYLTNITVNQGGTIAPGDSLGTLSISGSLILDAGAGLNYGLDTPSTSSMINDGSLALNNQQFTDFNFAWTTNFAPGNYNLIAFSSYSGNLGTITSGTIDGYAANLSVQGNDLLLTVVPEPSSLALLGAGILAAACTLRNSRRHTT